MSRNSSEGSNRSSPLEAGGPVGGIYQSVPERELPRKQLSLSLGGLRHLVPSLDPSIRGARRGLPSPISFSGEGIGGAGLGDKDLRAFFFF
ncbi:hypothetical protein QYF36_017849 [Acer negundo]|nr:hypothetical protein QYF36_017849 [Acer negundo]